MLLFAYMKSFGLWAVAKCLWFPDKLALSRLPPTPFPTWLTAVLAGLEAWLLFLGAVAIAPCLTELGFRSRTSWTHWLGKKPFWPRKMPSSIPLALSSPLVTATKRKVYFSISLSLFSLFFGAMTGVKLSLRNSWHFLQKKFYFGGDLFSFLNKVRTLAENWIKEAQKNETVIKKRWLSINKLMYTNVRGEWARASMQHVKYLLPPLSICIAKNALELLALGI